MDTLEKWDPVCRDVHRAAGGEAIQGGQKLRRSRDAKVYIEYLLISRLVITVSFLPIVWNDLHSPAIAQATHIGTLQPQGVFYHLNCLTFHDYGKTEVPTLGSKPFCTLQKDKYAIQKAFLNCIACTKTL